MDGRGAGRWEWRERVPFEGEEQRAEGGRPILAALPETPSFSAPTAAHGAGRPSVARDGARSTAKAVPTCHRLQQLAERKVYSEWASYHRSVG